MKVVRPIEEVKRVAYTRQEAATSLGMSVDTFERYVQPLLKVLLVGQLILIPPAELDRYVREHSQFNAPGIAA